MSDEHTDDATPHDAGVIADGDQHTTDANEKPGPLGAAGPPDASADEPFGGGDSDGDDRDMAQAVSDLRGRLDTLARDLADDTAHGELAARALLDVDRITALTSE